MNKSDCFFFVLYRYTFFVLPLYMYRGNGKSRAHTRFLFLYGKRLKTSCLLCFLPFFLMIKMIEFRSRALLYVYVCDKSPLKNVFLLEISISGVFLLPAYCAIQQMCSTHYTPLFSSDIVIIIIIIDVIALVYIHFIYAAHLTNSQANGVAIKTRPLLTYVLCMCTVYFQW